MKCKTPGEVLRKLRTDRGLTQKAVAEALNINRSTYSFHESGKTLPDFQRVSALAKIFEVPMGQMVEMLSNPEKTEQAAPKKRVPKKVWAEPAVIGQLRPEEKSLIAIFRRCDSATQKEIYRAAKEKLRS